MTRLVTVISMVALSAVGASAPPPHRPNPLHSGKKPATSTTHTHRLPDHALAQHHTQKLAATDRLNAAVTLGTAQSLTRATLDFGRDKQHYEIIKHLVVKNSKKSHAGEIDVVRSLVTVHVDKGTITYADHLVPDKILSKDTRKRTKVVSLTAYLNQDVQDLYHGGDTQVTINYLDKTGHITRHEVRNKPKDKNIHTTKGSTTTHTTATATAYVDSSVAAAPTPSAIPTAHDDAPPPAPTVAPTPTPDTGHQVPPSPDPAPQPGPAPVLPPTATRGPDATPTIVAYTYTPTPTDIPSPTATIRIIDTSTATSTAIATATSTPTATSLPTATITVLPTVTLTPDATPMPTATATPYVTPVPVTNPINGFTSWSDVEKYSMEFNAVSVNRVNGATDIQALDAFGNVYDANNSSGAFPDMKQVSKVTVTKRYPRILTNLTDGTAVIGETDLVNNQDQAAVYVEKNGQVTTIGLNNVPGSNPNVELKSLFAEQGNPNEVVVDVYNESDSSHTGFGTLDRVNVQTGQITPTGKTFGDVQFTDMQLLPGSASLEMLTGYNDTIDIYGDPQPKGLTNVNLDLSNNAETVSSIVNGFGDVADVNVYRDAQGNVKNYYVVHQPQGPNNAEVLSETDANGNIINTVDTSFIKAMTGATQVSMNTVYRKGDRIWIAGVLGTNGNPYGNGYILNYPEGADYATNPGAYNIDIANTSPQNPIDGADSTWKEAKVGNTDQLYVIFTAASGQGGGEGAAAFVPVDQSGNQAGPRVYLPLKRS